MTPLDAAGFLALHQADGTFVLPNVWDPGSAKVVAQAGFRALGTTSAGMAFAAGLPDEGGLGRDGMVERVAAIVAAVDVPVSADLESGYAASASGVGESIRAVIGAGAAGVNLEDADPSGLFPPAVGAERVAAARAAADGEGVPFVLNARIDSYLAGAPDPFADTCERAARYVAAGADCIFVPGAADAEVIAALVDAIDAPLNVVMGLTGTPLTLPELQRLGVRRVSVGGSLARAALAFVRRAADQIAAGDFSFATDAIPHGELNDLMRP